MTKITRFEHPAIFKRVLTAFSIGYFALALALPAIGVEIFPGSDFAKLGRDPLVAAICGALLLCLPLLSRYLRFAITLLVLAVVGFAVYRGHNYSAVIVLAGIALMLPRRTH